MRPQAYALLRSKWHRARCGASPHLGDLPPQVALRGAGAAVVSSDALLMLEARWPQRTADDPATTERSASRSRRAPGPQWRLHRGIPWSEEVSAVRTGFDPATSALTGQRSTQTELTDLTVAQSARAEDVPVFAGAHVPSALRRRVRCRVLPRSGGVFAPSGLRRHNQEDRQRHRWGHWEPCADALSQNCRQNQHGHRRPPRDPREPPGSVTESQVRGLVGPALLWDRDLSTTVDPGLRRTKRYACGAWANGRPRIGLRPRRISKPRGAPVLTHGARNNYS